MRVTIEHREEPAIFGRSFYVDCTVLFSEAERAVIRNRQLGKHSIEVGSDIPTGSGVDYFGVSAGLLRIASRIGLIGFIVTFALGAANVVNAGWSFAFFLLMTLPFAYRKWAEHQYAESLKFRYISLADLASTPKFTVYAADAFQAKQTEQSILFQLQELKSRLIAVAPGLASPQVYPL